MPPPFSKEFYKILKDFWKMPKKVFKNGKIGKLAGVKYDNRIIGEAQQRKNTPIYSGFVKYFPRAMAEVARLSKVANDQHNPGEPLHWAKEKSSDHLDALMRHLTDQAKHVEVDTDGQMHLTKVAWRGMAELEIYLETKENDR